MINIKRGRPDIHIWPEGLREFKKCLKIKSHAVACVLAFMQYKNISAIRKCYVSNHSNALNFPYILPSRTVQLKFRIVSTELRNTNTNNQKKEKSFDKTTISATFCQRIKTTKQHSGFTNHQNAKIPVQKSRTLEKLKIIFCSPLSTIYIGVSRYYEIEILLAHAFVCYTNRFMLLFLSTYGRFFF